MITQCLEATCAVGLVSFPLLVVFLLFLFFSLMLLGGANRQGDDELLESENTSMMIPLTLELSPVP